MALASNQISAISAVRSFLREPPDDAGHRHHRLRRGHHRAWVVRRAMHRAGDGGMSDWPEPPPVGVVNKREAVDA